MHNPAPVGNISVMTPRLRTLIDQVARSAEPDAVLLRRVSQIRDPAAFAELGRRYGRLVWGQCRHLLNSETDADDAFQATFLTLAKAARTVRDTNKLGPWLHGVAYRVCQQVKRTAARRTKREKATARSEAARPVADSAWDTAFAAVHDELAQLPDTLRVPFVLCVLEGKGTTEAAEQLGLKLGTFSARLSRAKQELFERLNARGLTAGLAAVGAVAVGASTAPAAVAAKACDLAAGGTVPANILSLSHGVLGMITMTAKRWVMTVVLGCGLAAGVGGVMTANAQDKKAEPAKPKSSAEDSKRLDALKQYQEAMDKAAEALKKQKLDEGRLLQKEQADKEWMEERERMIQKVLQSQTPEFLYLGQGSGYAPTAADFERTVKDVEAKGYTFVGVVTMRGQTKAKDNEAVPTLVFRRAARPGASYAKTAESTLLDKLKSEAKPKTTETKPDPKSDPKPKVEPEPKPKPKTVEIRPDSTEEKKLQAEIDRLTKELMELKKFEVKRDDVAVYLGTLADLGGDINEAAELVHGLLKAKYGAAASLKVKVTGDSRKGVLVYDATKEQAAWLMDMMKQLKSGGSAPKSNQPPK